MSVGQAQRPWYSKRAGANRDVVLSKLLRVRIGWWHPRRGPLGSRKQKTLECALAIHRHAHRESPALTDDRNAHADQPLFHLLAHWFSDRGNRATFADLSAPGIAHDLGRNNRPERRRKQLLDLSKAPIPGHLDNGCGDRYCIAGGQFSHLFFPFTNKRSSWSRSSMMGFLDYSQY
ncbi:hypothetical protein [Dictyobacter halimunensis]|uniref:hypothetical protein n=1 Tax=Dictyobacter halimunensis TaxID=3026934 RepID=UPI0030C77328